MCYWPPDTSSYGKGASMAARLVGSAASIEALAALIKARWHWSVVSIGQDGKVSNSKGEVSGLSVVKARGRYRLEMRG